LQQALSDLVSEQQMVNNAISTIQSLLGAKPSVARAARTVSPAAVARPIKATRGGGRRKPQWNSAMRKAARERMKRYWDARRKAKG
jgi:hypothetical protein